ncbi:hypothetical protein OPV22_002315 [Ensete ventricosum]|uniref:Uncharacterized protein n=1 Tax=Ensete ventricosum TaxID=4639 RepID=A0AAV8RXP2_ENSVE|nr:hypothetical protein OPV22_002315 [Ensete ventricosum]
MHPPPANVTANPSPLFPISRVASRFGIIEGERERRGGGTRGSPADQVDDQEAPFVVMCNVSSAAAQRTSISLQHVAVP